MTSAWRNGHLLGFRVAVLTNICLSSPLLCRGCSHLVHHIGWCSAAAHSRTAGLLAVSLVFGSVPIASTQLSSHQSRFPAQRRMTFTEVLHRRRRPVGQGKSLQVKDMLLHLCLPGLSRPFLSLPASLSSPEQRKMELPQWSQSVLDLSKLHDLKHLQNPSLCYVPDVSLQNTIDKTAHPSITSNHRHAVRELFTVRGFFYIYFCMITTTIIYFVLYCYGAYALCKKAISFFCLPEAEPRLQSKFAPKSQLLWCELFRGSHSTKPRRARDAKGHYWQRLSSPDCNHCPAEGGPPNIWSGIFTSRWKNLPCILAFITQHNKENLF